jgi:hypothetical protein
MELGVTRTQIVNKLSLSVHGKLEEYFPVIRESCSQDPEFLARLIAWDFVNGQIKDSKIALPVISLAVRQFPDELVENSLAHIAMQSPRELLKALRFAISSRLSHGRQAKLERTIRGFLDHKHREPGKWSRLAIRHRRALASLYALTKCPAPDFVSVALFGNIKGEKTCHAPGSVFADIAGLSKMEPPQVAATIQKWHLSPLIVGGAMAGAKAKQEDSAIVQATMNQMSDTEVITRAASLERKGLSRDASLKENFRKKVAKATKSNKATLKTSVAAEEVEDEGLKVMLRELQERQIQSQKDSGRGIDGNWLVIADKSQSQEIAIELGKHIAAAIAKFVTGRVWLSFCDTGGVGKEVTGKTLDEIRADSKFVTASGSTSYGVGLDWAMRKGFELDGVVIVGDGGENTVPLFHQAHKAYRDRKDLPVYFYQTYCSPQYSNSPGGNPALFETSMRTAGIPVTKFDLTKGAVDYYSLPNLVQQMNCDHFGLVEKIMACPLLTLEQVLPGFSLARKGEKHESVCT